MLKERINWTIDSKALNILKKASKHSDTSMSRIIESLILTKLGDPIQTLKEEKRSLAIKMNSISKSIEDLEKLKGGV